jgi:glycosyltransferase involved in cell wall biosynthesis
LGTRKSSALRVMFYDTAYLGHHSVWMEESVRALVDAQSNAEVLYAFPHALPVKATHVAYREPCSHKYLRRIQRYTHLPVYTAAKWRCLSRLVRQHAVDRVILMYLDDLLNPAFVPSIPFQWAGVYFHPRFIRNPCESSPIETLRSPSCEALYVLDSGVRTELAKLAGKPVFKIPDFCPTNRSGPTSKTELLANQANSRPIVGIIGPVTSHKNIGGILSVAQQRKDLHFLIAGPYFPQAITSHERILLAKVVKEPNVTAFLQHLPHGELNELTAMCSVHFAAYHDFLHSSNKLIRAAAWRIPLVVSDGGYMAECVRTHNMGVVCNPSDSQAISVAIDNALLLDRDHRGWEAYAEANSLEALRTALRPCGISGAIHA